MAQNRLNSSSSGSNGNGQCKICRSPYREQIDRMLLEGKTSGEIIRKFPNLGLNRTNIFNHKKHITPVELEEFRQIKLRKIDDLQSFIERIVQELLSKRIQPTTVNSLSRLLNLQLKTIEFSELEERISKLEKLVEKMRR